jgi:hypothetical protein
LIVAESEVRLGKIGGEGNGLLRGLSRAFHELWIAETVGVKGGGSPGDPRPGLSETRIEGRGLVVEVERLPHAGRIADGQAPPDFLAFQEGVVGGEVLRGLL